MDKNWLPEGHRWDLHIVKGPRGSGAGNFTGGGRKLVLHTTESAWDWADDGADYLVRERKEPHFIIGGRKGTEHPVVHQMLSLDEAGRALGNDNGDGFQTNRANAIQVEICWKAADMSAFSHYRALANLALLIDHRIPGLNVSAVNYSFKNPQRLTDAGFVKATGMIGHVHVPDNNHTDPGTGFRAYTLQRLIRTAPEKGWAL